MAKILIVEDQVIPGIELKKIVQDLGHEVVDHAVRYDDVILKALDHKPEVILMDINLGKGKDGIDAAVEIQAHYNPYIIYVTAYSDPSTLQKASLTDPDGYILKPYTKAQIGSAINLALLKDQKFKESLKVIEKMEDITELLQQTIKN